MNILSQVSATRQMTKHNVKETLKRYMTNMVNEQNKPLVTSNLRLDPSELNCVPFEELNDLVSEYSRELENKHDITINVTIDGRIPNGWLITAFNPHHDISTSPNNLWNFNFNRFVRGNISPSEMRNISFNA